MKSHFSTRGVSVLADCPRRHESGYMGNDTILISPVFLIDSQSGWLSTMRRIWLHQIGHNGLILHHRGTLNYTSAILKVKVILADYQQWHESEWIGWDIIPKWLTVYHCPNPIGLGRTSPQKKTSRMARLSLLLGPVGFEPTTNELWVRCSNHWAMDPTTGLTGLEPATTGSTVRYSNHWATVPFP